MSTATKAVAQHIDEAAWLEERKHGIGGSEVAAIFGYHPFKSAHDVWLEKMGRAPERKETPDMRRGRRLESVAVEIFEERTGLITRKQPMRRHKEYPFLLTSIDRQVIKKADLPTRALEVKCPRARTFWRFKREGLSDYIVLQGQQESLVWNYPETIFAIYGADDDELLTFPITFDPDVGRRIIEVVGEWWQNHIVKGIEPSEKAPTPDLKLPEIKGDVVFREDDQWQSACGDYFEARELVKEAEATKEMAKERIKQLIKLVPGVYETPGVFRFYFNEIAGRTTFDSKALAAVKPVDPMTITTAMVGAGINLEIATELIEQSRLDLSRFNKTGNPYTALTGYLLRGLEE